MENENKIPEDENVDIKDNNYKKNNPECKIENENEDGNVNNNCKCEQSDKKTQQQSESDKETQQDDINKQLEALKSELDEKTKKCNEYFNMLQRTAAEFDNYKKRTLKEKENIYLDAVADVIGSFLPVVDNLERALNSTCEDNSTSLREGIELILKQVREILKNNNVEEIKAVGEKFDPQLHNAVMHVEDENEGEGVVVEEFLKGYIMKDKVIRHSMVKVAN